MSKLKAVILVGTLKGTSEASNTLLLSQFLADHISAYDTDCEIIILAEYSIKPGTYTNLNSDDWPVILERILNSDIDIFATPVWWRNPILANSKDNRKVR